MEFKSFQTIKIIHDFIEYYSHICYLTARLYKRIEYIIFSLNELYQKFFISLDFVKVQH